MDTAIQKANERQEHVLSDEDAVRIYEMRQKAHWDFISSTNYARKEGREKGLKEGVEKSRTEIALRMKAAGRPFGEISEFTGLSPEAIDSL
jgi:predicted transposase/invertase (TIGR01784 family)